MCISLSRPAIAMLAGTLFTSLMLHAQYGAETSIPVEGPTAVEVLDMDNDDDNDVVLASRAGLMLLVNTDGQGTLSAPLSVSADDYVGHAADVDGDGYADLIGSLDLSGGVRWYRNLGTFGFGPPMPVATAITAERIASGDIDADGDLDVVAAMTDNALYWMENQTGMGQFAAMSFVAYASDVTALQAIDLDLDGDLDLGWSTESDQAYWAENTNGTGAFATASAITSNGRGKHADMDGDGAPDLAMVSLLNGSVQWQRKDIDGPGYDPATAIGNAPFPGPIHAADLDGDGDRDVVVGSDANDLITWHENLDGLGTFGPAQVVGAMVDDPLFISSGDLDRDGDLELFSASGAQQRVVRYDNLDGSTDLIAGRVFNDLDGDGEFDGADHGLYHVRVDLAGVGSTFTNHGGMYWFNSTPGVHTVNLPAVPGWQNTTAPTRSVTLGSPNTGSHDNDFGLQAAGNDHHLHAELTNAPTRCGMAITYWITVNNTGNQVEDLQISLDLDDRSGFVWSDPAPAANSGGVQTWSFNGVGPTHHRQIALQVLMADASHLGETMHDALTVDALQGGATTFAGTWVNDPVLECAYDPNDKTAVPVGDGPDHLTPMDSTLSYTVRFQNTGTIPAENVVIADQLDPALDAQSMQLIAASHPVHAFIDPAGQMTFSFENIQLPAESDDEPASHGFVRFRVAPLGGLPDMTAVHNTADIHFDANPAIVTNTTLNTLTYGLVGMEDLHEPAQISVVPNPAIGSATVYLGEALQGRVAVSMIDTEGREVRRVLRQSNTVVIDRGALPDGIYLLRATDERGTEAVTRLAWER